MKILQTIKYFFFIAINWSPRLAWFTIRHEIKGEKKYEIDSTGIGKVKGNKVTEKILSHAQHYQGANYYLLEQMFDFLKVEITPDNIIDFGSGKGRILAVAAHYGYKRITGIEISGELIKAADKNLSSIRLKFPNSDISILEMDAKEYVIPDDASLFFFFNPFDEKIMLEVVKNITTSLKKSEREMFVGYINPVHKEVFLSAGFTEVFYLEKFQYIECCILMYSPYTDEDLDNNSEDGQFDVEDDEDEED